MIGKPITTDLNPEEAAPPPADAAATAGILSDLRAGAAADSESELGDLTALTARPKRRVSTQTLVLALVLTASAASLYMMRKQGMRGGMKFRTPPIAHELDKVAPTPATEVRILADLARSGMPQRDADAVLDKNPFVLDTPVAETTGRAAVPDASADRQNMIRQRLGTVRLNGVMQGPVPLARINDRLVRVGDIVEDLFLVAQIHDRSVDLIADGHTYSLNMGEGVAGGNSVKRPPGGGSGNKVPPPPSNPRR